LKAQKVRDTGALRFWLSRDISGLNSFRTRSTNKYVRQIAYETLLDYDENEQLVPALAESWTISPDSKLYTIRLRRGVKFHNGEDLTAEDVKWSAEYAMDPKNAATGVTFLERVQAVNVKDKFTVEFVLGTPGNLTNLLANVEAAFGSSKGSVAPAQLPYSSRNRTFRIQRIQNCKRNGLCAQQKLLAERRSLPRRVSDQTGRG
jgi:ABC-type transport system substrate-binding protein